MRIAIISRKRSLYSTRRLAEAAKRLGHDVTVLDPLNCRMVLGRKRPELFHGAKPVKNISAIIPRIGASITEYGLAVVRQFETMGVASVNDSNAIFRARDKMRTLQLLSRFDIGIPKTVIAHKPENIREWIEVVGGAPVILKVIQGTQGVGVMLCESAQSAESVLDTLYAMGEHILIQQYIKEAFGRDIRAIVVGGKVVAAMARQAAKGEFRSNIHRGGKGTAITLSAEEENTAVRAASVVGLNIAGVDMIESSDGPLVMEVNHSPGLEGIERATGIDVAAEMVSYTAGVIAAAQSKP